MRGALLALLAALPLSAQERAKPGETVVQQDITIKGRAPAAPPAAVPAPQPDAAVVDEVLESLDLYRVDRAIRLPKVRLSALQRRLERPFPPPPYLVLSPRAIPAPGRGAPSEFERWSFSVFCSSSPAGGEARPLWRADGAGRLDEEVEWNGADALGRTVARAGDRCRFVFSGTRAGAALMLESEDVELSSLAYPDELSSLRLEVSLDRIFPPRSTEPLESAGAFLAPMAERLERASPPGTPLRLQLRQKDPDSALARRRAEELVVVLSGYRVLSRERFRVDRLPPGDRGEIVACELPPDKGATIRTDEEK